MNNRRKLLVALGAGALAVMALMGDLIWSGYREAIHAAETTTRNYAAIIEARLDATLRRADADLQDLVRTIPVAALSTQAVPRYARELGVELDVHMTNFPELSGLRIFDANGDRLYATANVTVPPTHVSDRGYFRLLRDNPQAGLVFSEVIISRTTGRPSVPIAKALRDGQGAFRGIVSATIELDYFQKLFQSLDLGAQGIVAIHRNDNFSLVTRWPVGGGKINIPLPPDNPARTALAPGVKKATVEFSSSNDGVLRIYSFNVLDRYPFFVTAALAREDVLAGWKARALTVGVSGLLLVGLLAGLLYRLWRVEASLRVNEELMRSTFEQAAVGIAHIDPDTYRILMANDEFCNLLGYTQDELIGTDSRILTPPDEMPEREAERAQVMAGTIKTSSCERRLIRKDGASLWINRSLSLVRDAAGQPQYFISVIEDVSARKQAEEARARLAAVAESSSDAIFIRDLDGKIIFWNDGATRVYGYTADEMIGTDGDIAIPPDLLRERRQKWEEVRQGGTVANYETVRIHKDGRRIDVSISMSPIKDHNGKIIGVARISRDITERKRADETRAQLAAIVENANDAIIGRSLDGTITSWNAAAERIFGYSASEAIGRSASILTPEPLRRQTENNERLRRGIPVPAQERMRVTKDGRIISVMSSISPVRNDAGKVVSAAIITHDISALKQAQHELEQLNRELEQRVTERTAELAAANLELEAFSYSVAHDLRAPLRAINGYSALVLEAIETRLDQASVDNLKRVRAASDRMGAVIDDLLNLTQLSRQEMQWRDFNLSESAATVVAALTGAHPERSVPVTIQPDMNTHGDPGLMRIMLENLIGNAWKFTAKTGAARIEIGTGQRDGQTVYYVRDNGAGFDMKYAHKLFAPFQRLHHADEFEGTGIGLATVKKIIQRHLGKIWIESAVDVGTTVFFTVGKST